MKYKLAIILLMAVTASLAWADNPEFRKTVYSPKKGVVCDIELNYCVNKKGISLEDSKAYLGESSYQYIKQVKKSLQQASVFALSNGVFCNIKYQHCYLDSQITSANADVSGKMTYFIFDK